MNSALFPLPHIEDCPKRIRVYTGGVCLIDTKKAKYVWLHPHYPTYFVPQEELPMKWYLQHAGETEHEIQYHVLAGLQPNSAPSITLYKTGALAGLAVVKFDAMEAWFEEDEQIFIHPRDPYKRVDIVQSSRHIRVEAGGVEVANSRAPRMVFETGLPVRYYIPKTDCRMDLWEVSPTKTGCPYKGVASYYNIVLSSGEIIRDVVWWYPTTVVEASALRGFVAFYDEKLDVWIDGEKQERGPIPEIPLYSPMP
ncbi:hypothetical protein D9619_003962 [Psilocybe cf. subviscida]|uniref:DUF427 domain-containing protein n=1 Tax=Psilocybe cf. subviscida TaxID=2480587 RepID=A0A8H5F7L9_9AGAR|nr:hypothetical protein D9619_003962 [Psilocybe cf. subviscida]